jgi:hypothetical protein
MTLNAKNQGQLESRISADFIKHDPNLPRGISDGLEYDEQRATFKIKSRSRYVPSLWQDHLPVIDFSRDAIQLTKGALELYYSSGPTEITFSSNVTWDDVSRTAKEAREDQNDQKNPTLDNVIHRLDRTKAEYSSKGRLHKFGRSFGDIAPAIVHKLDYAPDEMYIGIICQGLKFIFDVSTRRLLSSFILAVVANDIFRSPFNSRRNEKRFSTLSKTYPN